VQLGAALLTLVATSRFAAGITALPSVIYSVSTRPTFVRADQEDTMNTRAPNVALFVVAGCLAMMGVLSALPIDLPIPGLNANNSALYIFLGWFLLSAGSVLPESPAMDRSGTASPVSGSLQNR
jgi:hypothetical protein